MKRSRFSEEQIVYTIRQAESGTPIGDLCRQLGVSEATFSTWKRKYAHLGVSELRRLRQVEEENARLKRLVADLSLDKPMLSEALQKNLRPARRLELAQWFHGTFRVSGARACRLAQFGRASWYRKSQAKDQTALLLRIRDLAHARPGFGYLRIWVLLRREGWAVNRKRVRRWYRLEGLQLRMRVRGGSTSRCIVDQRPYQRAPPSAGAWILCMIPWPTVTRIEFSPWSIIGVAPVRF